MELDYLSCMPYTTLFRSHAQACVRGAPRRGDPPRPDRRARLLGLRRAGARDRLGPGGPAGGRRAGGGGRSEEHTSELQSRRDLVCRLLLEKKKKKKY